MLLSIWWYFFIYAFLGWCTEVIYAAGTTGKFVNRGFLNGPFCPIYGVGFLLVFSMLYPVKDNILFTFLGAVFITSAIELIVGYLLEKIFNQRWWDYSDMPYNLGGYICLLFSLRWGLACLVIIDRIHPIISSFVGIIPQTASQIILVILTGLLVVDFIATVRAILNLNEKLEIIDEITLKIRDTSDNIGENIAKGAIALVQKKDDLEESFEAKKEGFQADIAELKEAQQKAFAHRKQMLSDLQQTYRDIIETTNKGQKRLLQAFPDLKSIYHKDALEKIKSTILKGLGVSNEAEKEQ